MGSNTPQYAPNHTIDVETGFIESKGYLKAFDASRKKQFLDIFRNNGLGLYRTCKMLDLAPSTVNKHYQIDPAFKAAFDEARIEYGDELEATSRQNALNPKSVIERIFQLKSFFPEKYSDQKNQSTAQVNISIDASLLQNISKRQTVLEAEIMKADELLESKP